MWSNVVVGVVVLAAALYAGYRLIRRPASGCGCGCSGSSGTKAGSRASDSSAGHGGCCGGKGDGCGCSH
jgi:hypothetical protein